MFDNVKLPRYNNDGKKLTFQQHLRKKQRYEEDRQRKYKGSETNAGKCHKCKGSAFTLKVFKQGENTLLRTCKNPSCKAEKHF